MLVVTLIIKLHELYTKRLAKPLLDNTYQTVNSMLIFLGSDIDLKFKPDS
ncbi:hypothetical protein F0Z19_2657 [Vibrio cyclitrophicus]|nr:hypothetical protein F0Z19_2657 [Vibrio cyclitrophicus]